MVTIMAAAMVMRMAEHDALARMRLWQLLSPTLPIGAYSYSGGLETAVELRWVDSADGVERWVSGLLLNSLARVDVPLLARLHQAWLHNDDGLLLEHAAWLRACRESAELADEDQQIGRALATLLCNLGVAAAQPWINRPTTAWAVLHALALTHWDIPLREGVEAYLWSWCDNQIAAAVKLVPLGQTDGQRLLLTLAGTVHDAAEHGLALGDTAIGACTPGLAIASCLHESQYSRLFRS